MRWRRCTFGSMEERSSALLPGWPAPPLALNVGNNVVEVRVTAVDGTTTNTYRSQCQPGASAVYLDFPGCFPAEHADVESGWRDPRRHSVRQPRTSGGGPHPGRWPRTRRPASRWGRSPTCRSPTSSISTMGRGPGRWPRLPVPGFQRHHHQSGAAATDEASSRTTRLASTSSLSSSRRTPRLSRPAFKIKLP